MIESTFEWIKAFLSENELASGGIAIALATSLIYKLRALPNMAWEWIKRRSLVRIEVLNSDPLYERICEWISKQPQSARFRSTTALTRVEEGTGVRGKRGVYFVPSPGRHVLKIGRHRVLVDRERDAAGTGGNDFAALLRRESIRLIGMLWARKSIEGALREATKVDRSTDIDVLIARGDYWQTLGKVPRRMLSSLVYDDALGNRLLADARRFLQSQNWYADRGIPWRRGYLMYGPPGNGKSSLVRAIASELQMGMAIVNLSEYGMSDASLLKLLSEVGRDSILLLEDIDCVFENREADKAAKHVTFSGLLNAIDGVAAAEGRVLFMTTNRLDKLDDALIRPGRIDMRAEVRNATQEQALMLFGRFFPEADRRLAIQFASSIEDGEYSMADLQGRLLLHVDDPEAAARTMNRMRAMA